MCSWGQFPHNHSESFSCSLINAKCENTHMQVDTHNALTHTHTQTDWHTAHRKSNTLRCVPCNQSLHPNRCCSSTSLSLGENNLAGPSGPRISLSSGGQQILRGRYGFWVEEAQLLHRELWKQLSHHPNAPETIHQLLSNTHKLFCQPIVLSHHIIAWRIILTSFAAHKPTQSNWASKINSWPGSDNNWRDGM